MDNFYTILCFFGAICGIRPITTLTLHSSGIRPEAGEPLNFTLGPHRDLMDQSTYLSLMQFPPEWFSWQMLPVEFLSEQASSYELGHEDASEYDRHGIFQWWLRHQPDVSVLIKLVNLSWLDPEDDEYPAIEKRAKAESAQEGCAQS